MKYYFVIVFFILFFIVADNAYTLTISSGPNKQEQTYCICSDQSKVDVGEYCLTEGTEATWKKCILGGEFEEEITTPCSKGFFYYNNSKCISCAEATGNNDATTNGPATAMYDCYIPKDKTDSDEKGEFTYVAQCYVGCTDSNSYLCPSA